VRVGPAQADEGFEAFDSPGSPWVEVRKPRLCGGEPHLRNDEVVADASFEEDVRAGAAERAPLGIDLVRGAAHFALETAVGIDPGLAVTDARSDRERRRSEGLEDQPTGDRLASGDVAPIRALAVEDADRVAEAPAESAVDGRAEVAAEVAEVVEERVLVAEDRVAVELGVDRRAVWRDDGPTEIVEPPNAHAALDRDDLRGADQLDPAEGLLELAEADLEGGVE